MYAPRPITEGGPLFPPSCVVAALDRVVNIHGSSSTSPSQSGFYGSGSSFKSAGSTTSSGFSPWAIPGPAADEFPRVRRFQSETSIAPVSSTSPLQITDGGPLPLPSALSNFDRAVSTHDLTSSASSTSASLQLRPTCRISVVQYDRKRGRGLRHVSAVHAAAAAAAVVVVATAALRVLAPPV